MKDRGFCMLIRAGKISEKVVKEFPNSLLIYSMWEGYLNKNHTAFNESISNIVGTAKEVGSKYQYLHTSGHATVDDIKKVCEITNAKMIIPIHTEAPEVFTKMSIAGEIVLLKDGEGVTV
jgi:ribonuclease J